MELNAQERLITRHQQSLCRTETWATTSRCLSLVQGGQDRWRLNNGNSVSACLVSHIRGRLRFDDVLGEQ